MAQHQVACAVGQVDTSYRHWKTIGYGHNGRYNEKLYVKDVIKVDLHPIYPKQSGKQSIDILRY